MQFSRIYGAATAAILGLVKVGPGLSAAADGTLSLGASLHNDQYTTGATSYTLAAEPIGAVVLYWNGVVQASGQFSVIGTTLTLGFAPSSGDAVTLVYLA